MSEETESTENESVRLDIWLWATRLSKTRSLATGACKRNRVEVNGQTAKPSRNVRTGDQIQYRRGPLTRTVEVKAVISKRIGAKLVDDFLIDHTPKEEYEKAAAVSKENRAAKPKRDAGSGRPTKKDRRDINEVMEDSADEATAFEAFAKAMKKNLSLFALFFGLISFAGFAQDEKAAPPKRSFEVKEGVPEFKVKEDLIVYARKISPEKNPETGALTAMAATGDVLIKAKPKGAPDWILVACDKAVYDPTEDSIKLTGFPAVKSGMQLIRATDASTYVSVNRSTGKWEIKGPHKIEVNLGAFKKKK